MFEGVCIIISVGVTARTFIFGIAFVCASRGHGFFGDIVMLMSRICDDDVQRGLVVVIKFTSADGKCDCGCSGLQTFHNIRSAVVHPIEQSAVVLCHLNDCGVADFKRECAVVFPQIQHILSTRFERINPPAVPAIANGGLLLINRKVLFDGSAVVPHARNGNGCHAGQRIVAVGNRIVCTLLQIVHPG